MFVTPERAVTLFMAKLACRHPHPNGMPCSNCVDYCHEYMTSRAYPAMLAAFRNAVTEIDFFRTLSAEMLKMGPNVDPPLSDEEKEEEDHSEDWKGGK